MSTATLERTSLTLDDPDLLRATRAALADAGPVVVRVTGAAARRAATVFLGGDFRLYDGVRTPSDPEALRVVLQLTRLSDLARVIALGRARGCRVDVEYVDEAREFRLALVPPPA
ncbi:hypothetical protein [Geodermatophilus chilensis]|jgi:hypothetical protein|uniref:hypothetical protein n=1 Tax=Geodermatophilus chilensis TaxID=2035835 RepID=UPI000C2592BA|nr:hypothetical protein [Geodermatophilus chilensis]